MIHKEAWYKESNEREINMLQKKLYADPLNEEILEDLFRALMRSGHPMNWQLIFDIAPDVVFLMQRQVGASYSALWNESPRSNKLVMDPIVRDKKYIESIVSPLVIKTTKEFIDLLNRTGKDTKLAEEYLKALQSKDGEALAEAVADVYSSVYEIYSHYSSLTDKMLDKYLGARKLKLDPEKGTVLERGG